MGNSGPLEYVDLWYGEETHETNSVFSARHFDNKEKFENLIESKSLTIVSREEITRTISRYKLKAKNDEVFFILYSPLVHSGGHNNRLRSHIPPAIINNGSHSAKTHLVGSYNAGDVTIYVFGDITNFINKSESSQYNTSFWIGDIARLFDIYNNGESFWYRNNEDVLLLGLTSEKIKTIDSSLFIKRFLNEKELKELGNGDELSKAQNELQKLAEMFYVDPIKYDDNFLQSNLKNELKRNKEYRKAALIHAGYKCELCGREKTFETKNGEQYFDGHHLIMYNVKSQERFEYSLDIPRNIVCLCPECHKKIHFSKDEQVKDMLIELFLKHKDLFKIYEIESLDEIIADYTEYREEEL